MGDDPSNIKIAAQELFRSRLDAALMLIFAKHPLLLGQQIDWSHLKQVFSATGTDKPGS